MNDIIAARRKAIQDGARCEGCGATLAQCKAQRGKDPSAPEWFGCCARGLALSEPCRHVPDAGALLALLTEIESGTVRTVEEATPKPPAKEGMTWSEYLDQGKQWKPEGRGLVAIAVMDPEWRYNASRWLERHAAPFASRYSLEESFDLLNLVLSPIGPGEMSADSIQSEVERGADERRRDPVAWIRTTNLYQALVAGLPTKRKELARLAERARHYSTCPVRIAPAGADAPCTCPAGISRAPEWTL